LWLNSAIFRQKEDQLRKKSGREPRDIVDSAAVGSEPNSFLVIIKQVDLVWMSQTMMTRNATSVFAAGQEICFYRDKGDNSGSRKKPKKPRSPQPRSGSSPRRRDSGNAAKPRERNLKKRKH
ncbi:hypothetical protein ANCCAN_14735, partial [Ancylostoma caninum]